MSSGSVAICFNSFSSAFLIPEREEMEKQLVRNSGHEIQCCELQSLNSFFEHPSKCLCVCGNFSVSLAEGQEGVGWAQVTSLNNTYRLHKVPHPHLWVSLKGWLCHLVICHQWWEPQFCELWASSRHLVWSCFLRWSPRPFLAWYKEGNPHYRLFAHSRHVKQTVPS